MLVQFAVSQAEAGNFRPVTSAVEDEKEAVRRSRRSRQWAGDSLEDFDRESFPLHFTRQHITITTRLRVCTVTMALPSNGVG